MRGLAGQRRGDRADDVGGCVPVGQQHDQRVAAGALRRGRRGGLVGCADDQVAFPMARLGPVGCGGRPLAGRAAFPERAVPLGAAAAQLAPSAPRRQLLSRVGRRLGVPAVTAAIAAAASVQPAAHC